MNPIIDVTLAEYFSLLFDGRRMRCTPVYRVCDCGCLVPLAFATVLVSNDRGDGRPPMPVRVSLEWSKAADHTQPADLLTNN